MPSPGLGVLRVHLLGGPLLVLQHQLTAITDAHVSTNLAELPNTCQYSSSLTRKFLLLSRQLVQRTPCFLYRGYNAWTTAVTAVDPPS